MRLPDVVKVGAGRGTTASFRRQSFDGPREVLNDTKRRRQEDSPPTERQFPAKLSQLAEQAMILLFMIYSREANKRKSAEHRESSFR